MTDEIFGFFSYDPEAIQTHLESGKALCMVLNKNLAGRAIGQGAGYGYLLVNPYQGEERLVVAGGCYKKPVKRFDLPDPNVIRKCKKAQQLTDGIYAKKILKAVVEDPLSIVLSNELEEESLAMFARTYETFKVDYNNETHTAIACLYYDPNYQTEGKILAQWYEPTALV